jgi:hypothetical protein
MATHSALTPQSTRWQVVSLSVKVRDGPRRLQAAYRLLLAPCPQPAACGGTLAPLAPDQEDCHARRAVCPRLD